MDRESKAKIRVYREEIEIVRRKIVMRKRGVIEIARSVSEKQRSGLSVNLYHLLALIAFTVRH